VVHFNPNLSNIIGSNNGTIILLIALRLNNKLNYASSIFKNFSISLWRGDWELPQNELKKHNFIQINKKLYNYQNIEENIKFRKKNFMPYENFIIIQKIFLSFRYDYCLFIFIKF
jgi:hypothetical protein